jgi:hypothetical protein
LNQPPKITWFSGTDLKSGDVTYEIWRLEVNCMRKQNYDNDAMLIAVKDLHWEKQVVVVLVSMIVVVELVSMIGVFAVLVCTIVVVVVLIQRNPFWYPVVESFL